MLISFPNQVMGIALSASQPGMLSFSVTLDAPLRHSVQAEDGFLRMLVQAPSLVEPNYSHFLEESIQYSTDPEKQGVRGLVTLKICQQGGTVSTDGNGLRVDGADSAVLWLAARTSFRGYDHLPDIPAEELCRQCLADLDGAGDFVSVRRAHVTDYRSYFDRVDFFLECDDRSDLPTNRRLEVFDPVKPDMGLYPLLFQYGRYLMIAGSRPGSQPLNLQGIWNHQVRPPWSSNYTLNINTQMNYWPVFACDLFDMQEPLARLVQELAASGGEMAEKLYGVQGTVCHHNTDLWRFTWPVGNHVPGCTSYSFWNMSIPCLCGQLYERYLYTRDPDDLRKIYPAMNDRQSSCWR